MSKYKYYLRKPKSEIAKDIFLLLAISGAIAIAATSPYFGVNALKIFRNREKYSKKKVYDAFYQLRKQGYINIEKRGHRIHISLTEDGKKKAGRLQIDSLRIPKPKKWDKKFRIVLFDISQLKTFYRNALRGKLQELGFIPLQKSVWVCPYPCRDEVATLRDFFGLTVNEVRLITAEYLEGEEALKKWFRLL